MRQLACRFGFVGIGVISGVFFLLTTASVFAQRSSASASDVEIEWPSEAPPPPLIEQSVVFPEYQIRTLDNGLQVVFVGHHEQPIVNARLLVRAGASSDSRDKPGVAALAARLLNQGTATRTAQEIAGIVDYVGGALDVGAGPDLSFVNTIMMSDSFSLALDMLSDVARSPAFFPEEIERQRQQGYR